ncbi:MAG: hypothetical protein Q7W30_05635 [Coriobacteriia bacterium]|nr:hypothetical protein [Coriobacteriia bacterium]
MAELPGHRRRIITRWLVGRPGSIRRWALASVIGLVLACATLNIYVVLAVAMLSTGWILYMRTMLVEGDEDELRAWLRWQNSRKNPDRLVPEAEAEPIDRAEWSAGRHGTFIDVPPPPILDDAELPPE